MATSIEVVAGFAQIAIDEACGEDLWQAVETSGGVPVKLASGEVLAFEYEQTDADCAPFANVTKGRVLGPLPIGGFLATAGGGGSASVRFVSDMEVLQVANISDPGELVRLRGRLPIAGRLFAMEQGVRVGRDFTGPASAPLGVDGDNRLYEWTDQTIFRLPVLGDTYDFDYATKGKVLRTVLAVTDEFG